MSEPAAPAPEPSTSSAPPEPDLEARPAPSTVLYTPAHIGIASLVATPIAGALLASSNLARRGQLGAGRAVVAGATVVVAAVVAVDAQGFGALTLWVSPLWALAAFALARAVFPGVAATRRALAGAAVAVGGVWLALGVVGAGAAAFLRLRAPSPAEISADAVIAAPGQVVDYRDGAARADAERVAAILRRASYFAGDNALRVVVDLPGPRLRVSVTVSAPLTPKDAEAGRRLVRAVAVGLSTCVDGRLASVDGTTLASGTQCP